MSLSDIVGRLGVEAAPVVALVLFLFAFALILISALGRSRQAEFDRAARLPLDADAVPPTVTLPSDAPGPLAHPSSSRASKSHSDSGRTARGVL